MAGTSGEIEYDFWSIKRIFVSYQTVAGELRRIMTGIGEARRRDFRGSIQTYHLKTINSPNLSSCQNHSS
jgi:hypothetical protein